MENNCAHMGPRLNALLKGEVGEQERKEIEAHLETCPGCQKEFEELKTVDAFLQETFEPEKSPEINFDRVWGNIQPQLDFSPSLIARIINRFKKPLIWMPPLLAAAAAALMLMILPTSKPSLPAIATQVESISCQSGQVMVMNSAEAGQPLIWIFQETGKEAS